MNHRWENKNLLTFLVKNATTFDPFCADAESFRVPRQAEEEQEEQGTIAKISNTIRSYYDSVVDTACGYVESVRGLKLEEKAV